MGVLLTAARFNVALTAAQIIAEIWKAGYRVKKVKGKYVATKNGKQVKVAGTIKALAISLGISAVTAAVAKKKG